MSVCILGNLDTSTLQRTMTGCRVYAYHQPCAENGNNIVLCIILHVYFLRHDTQKTFSCSIDSI